jgi:hypothetical protein
MKISLNLWIINLWKANDNNPNTVIEISTTTGLRNAKARAIKKKGIIIANEYGV